MYHLKSTTSLSVLVALCGFGSAAYAAETDTSSFELEEIVVTAQKRAEDMQKIPIAITVLSGNRIREDGITDLSDIAGRTPGMTFGSLSPAQPEIAIRGIGTKEDGAAASDSTLVSVDDVYIASRTAQIFDIFDLERIEVLRGPQGTLYGKNSIAGSVNFVTTKPTEDTTMRFRQTVGDYGRFDTAGMISGQVAENLFGKFSFSRRKHDGYILNVLESYIDPLSGERVKNPSFGKYQDESNTFAWRSHLRWVASDTLEVTLMLDGADDDLGAQNREPVDARGPLHDTGGANPVLVNEALGGADSPWTGLTASDGYTKRTVFGAALKVNWDLEWAGFTSITAYRESELDWLFDANGLPPGGLFADLTGASGNPGPALAGDPANGFSFQVDNIVGETTKQYTQEFRLTSQGDGAYDWVTGVFFTKEEVDRWETFFFPSLGGPGLTAQSDWTSFQDGDTAGVAAYVQGTYHVSDAFSVTGGIRYSWEERKFEGYNVQDGGVPLILRTFEDENGPRNADVSNTWSNVSWKIAGNYEVTEDAMVYASISTGFKSGGYTGSATSLEQAEKPFDAEKVTNYEVGFKSVWLDRRFLLNITGFYMDYQDLQVTRFFVPEPASFGQFVTENAGSAEIKGIEVEYTLLPFEGAELGGSYAYLDGIYKDFEGSPGVDGSGDFSGTRMRQAPEHMLNLYAKFLKQLGDENGSISAKIDYRYVSLIFFDPGEDPIATSPGHDVWDGSVTWYSESNVWQVKGWIKNIGNAKYIKHAFSQRGNRMSFADYGAPRTIGVTATYSY
ncbi:MAG: TonB-dependent receptor [Kordiimonadaceae bacterium]|nr:TonB-dependent receptor [Kordiimonadaceae bacterium]